MTPGASNTVSEGGQNQTPIRGQYLPPIDTQMDQIALIPDGFHGEWNYELLPR